MPDTLLIRADADAQIGTGHVMRCLALAQAWAERGGSVILIAAERLPPALKGRFETEGFGVRAVTAPSGSPADADQTIAMAREAGTRAVVVDGYVFGSDYQHRLKRAGLPLLFLDDYVHADHYVADFVLNQNIGATESLYARREPYTQLLLGARYILLRREFWSWRGVLRDIPSQATKVLITMGGSDAENVTARVLQALEHIAPPLDVVVVVGGGNPHGDALHAMAGRSRHRIQLKHNVQEMPALMAWADLAISASGSTVWELAYLGLPSILVTLAENQHPIADEMAKRGIMRSLGSQSTIPDLAAAIADLMNDPTWRERYSRAGQTLLDGYGAVRVVNALIGPTPLRLRPVDSKDALLLWTWANDADARANSFHSEAIPWKTHLNWYTARLQSPSTRFWMLEVGGVPVAHIRYERLENETAEISYTVGPDERGKGYGTRLLIESWPLACQELHVGKVHGTTFETNLSSQRAFEKAGFTLAERKIVEGRACLVFSIECGPRE